MAAYDLEEQEQIDAIKTWWKMYGNRLVNVLMVIALGVAAWQVWNYFERSKSAEASLVFHVLQKSVQEKNTAQVKTTAAELFEKYGRTSYAALGGLAAAKALVEEGDSATAKIQLAWVAEHGKDEMREFARLRLAALLLDDKEFDNAKKALDGQITAGFGARFADLRGDILLAEGKKEEAGKAWNEALKELDAALKVEASQASAQFRELIRQKRDSAIGNSEENTEGKS